MPQAALAMNKPRNAATLRKINLWVLRRLQLLDEERTVQSVFAIAELLVGLHAKRPQTPYLSLLARMSSLQPGRLNESLYQKREVLRAHAMRGTVHMLPLSQYETVLTATRGQLDNMYRRAFSKLSNKAEIENAIYSLIEKGGAMSHSQIARQLRSEIDERDLHRLLNDLCTRGLLVKSTVNGTWRSSIYNYEILKRWQPRIPGGEMNVEQARTLLVKWYLKSYGPATSADVAWWTGFSQATVKQAIARLAPAVESVFFEALGQHAWMLIEDLEALEQWNPPKATQINLLPSFDPYVVAYIDRQRCIDTNHYKKVFKGVSGIIEPVITCDGRIVGTWKYELKDGRIPALLFDGATVDPELLESCITQTSRFLGEADRMRDN